MTLSARQRFVVLARDGFRCTYCGRDASDGVALEVDHIVPQSRGGTDHADNLVTACRDCNGGKSNLEIFDTHYRRALVQLPEPKVCSRCGAIGAVFVEPRKPREAVTFTVIWRAPDGSDARPKALCEGGAYFGNEWRDILVDRDDIDDPEFGCGYDGDGNWRWRGGV